MTHYAKALQCPHCDTPGDGKCAKCYGSGTDLHLNSDKPACESCQGTGKCPACQGTGRKAGGIITLFGPFDRS